MASYGTTTGVSARVPAIGLGASTVPSTTQVTSWLEQAYSIINRKLAGAGYSMPVSSDADVYEELTDLNELYAAAWALRARGMDSITGTPENRADEWMAEFWRRLDELAGSDLTLAGVSQVAAGTTRRRLIRSTQVRRIDGYSGLYEGDYTDDYDNPSE